MVPYFWTIWTFNEMYNPYVLISFFSKIQLKYNLDRTCFPMCWFGLPWNQHTGKEIPYTCGPYLFPYVLVWGVWYKMQQKSPNLLYGPWSQTPALDSGLCIPLLGRLAVKVCLQNPGLALLVLDGDLLKDIFIMSLLSGPGCAAWVLNLWLSYTRTARLDPERRLIMNMSSNKSPETQP